MLFESSLESCEFVKHIHHRQCISFFIEEALLFGDDDGGAVGEFDEAELEFVLLEAEEDFLLRRHRGRRGRWGGS